MSESLFLDTCHGKITQQKPVWIMRQAGRYLPEYRELRQKHPSFLKFCATPEAAARVTLQPVERFGLDAAILFSDILVLLPPLGLDLEFRSGFGPHVSNPMRTQKDFELLEKVDVERDLAYVGEAIRLIKKELSKGIPLLGFAGGPLTVASYLIEGKSSKDLAHTKAMIFGKPDLFRKIMSLLAETTAQYLIYQARQGADALVIMDSWAGFLSPCDYREHVLGHTKNIIRTIRSEVDLPILHYANGAATLLDEFVTLDADALGLDWRLPLEKALEKHPKQIFQGNLDPSLLFAPEDLIRKRTREILDLVGNRPHIMNLGHGILPSTPIAGVEAYLSEIRKN